MRLRLFTILALILATMSLSACVVVPAHQGYYNGPSVYVRPPPVIIDTGPYWGGRHWRRW